MEQEIIRKIKFDDKSYVSCFGIYSMLANPNNLDYVYNDSKAKPLFFLDGALKLKLYEKKLKAHANKIGFPENPSWKSVENLTRSKDYLRWANGFFHSRQTIKTTCLFGFFEMRKKFSLHDENKNQYPYRLIANSTPYIINESSKTIFNLNSDFYCDVYCKSLFFQEGIDSPFFPISAYKEQTTDGKYEPLIFYSEEEITKFLDAKGLGYKKIDANYTFRECELIEMNEGNTKNMETEIKPINAKTEKTLLNIIGALTALMRLGRRQQYQSITQLSEYLCDEYPGAMGLNDSSSTSKKISAGIKSLIDSLEEKGLGANGEIEELSSLIKEPKDKK